MTKEREALLDTLLNGKRHRKLEGIDIEKEYELIQQKRCMHPVSIRNLIVYRYEKAMRDADDMEARQALEESSGPMDED